MLVPMKEMLQDAQQGGYAVPGFNYYNQASADGITEEAEERASPVVLMLSGVYLDSLGLGPACALAFQAARRVKVPVAVHLDHGKDYSVVETCVQAGFTSVMIDGSHLNLEDNIALTARVVAMAHARGVTVEAELGTVGGVEDAVYGTEEAGKSALIAPEQAARFVRDTGIDCLAPAIGNVHGLTAREPRLDLALLAKVRAAVEVPLALHGGSGISDPTILALVRGGMNKINIGSELKAAWKQGLAEYFATGGLEPRLGMQAAKHSIRKTVGRKIELCGSAGKA
jgi:ketose-bisphosphate aldolase